MASFLRQTAKIEVPFTLVEKECLDRKAVAERLPLSTWALDEILNAIANPGFRVDAVTFQKAGRTDGWKKKIVLRVTNANRLACQAAAKLAAQSVQNSAIGDRKKARFKKTRP